MGHKRCNGEGNIRRRKNGQWEAAVMDGYRPDGRIKMKYFTGKSQKEVKDKLDRWRTDKAAGLDVSSKRTFTEWSNFWFECHKHNITPTTQENYKCILRILQDYFGTWEIENVKPIDIETFLRIVSDKGYSDKTRSQCRGMLFQIFKKAAANDLMRKNPVAYADRLRSVNPPKEKESYTADETKLLLNNLPNNKMGWSIRLLIGTGMRTQELLALEPKHIAEDGSTISICRAVNVVKGRVYVGQPKTRDSKRTVVLPENMWVYARALRNTTDKYIWQSPKRDAPCNPSYFRDKYKEAISCVDGVRVLSPHCCRHTHVSLMQEAGADLTAIQVNVGHAHVDMTHHYLHVQDSVRENAARKFSEAFPIDSPYTPELRPVELF